MRLRLRLLTRLSEGASGRAFDRTFRQPSGLVAGSLGALFLATRGLFEADPVGKWEGAIGAVIVAWCGWTCRMTLRSEGVVVQNSWTPKTYPWHEIQTARMTTPRFHGPVLALYLKDGRRIRVWAVSVVQGIGEGYCSRARNQLLASLKESHGPLQPGP